ncbi:MAG: hypothetical protein HY579_06495 [Nitrospinae bacterium]|nr:hypothetical protein [Nitrospinota bacterium]
MIRDKINQLVEYVTHNHFSDEVYKAKKEYQEVAGEVFEDDRTYETRIAAFLEWFAFDRIMPEKQKCPAEVFLDENANALSADQTGIFMDFTRNTHGIFIMKKIKDDEVTALNLFDDNKYTVSEKESKVIFRKNDLFEGRIFPFQGKNYFSGTFCFHPAESLKFVKDEVKKVAATIQQWEKQVKKINSDANDLQNKIYKTGAEIAKTRVKLDEAGPSASAGKLKIKLMELESKKNELQTQKESLEARKNELESRKIRIEGRFFRERLIQRLGYMNLKWERSRHIALSDIYKN